MAFHYNTKDDEESEEEEDEVSEYVMTEEERLEAEFDAKHMKIGACHVSAITFSLFLLRNRKIFALVSKTVDVLFGNS